MNLDPERRLRAIARLTVSIRLAVSTLVLAAILLTAALSSLLWWRTAEATSRQLASTINEQIVAAVRKEVSAIVEKRPAVPQPQGAFGPFNGGVLDVSRVERRQSAARCLMNALKSSASSSCSTVRGSGRSSGLSIRHL